MFFLLQDGVYNNIFYQAEDGNFRLSLTFKGVVEKIRREHFFIFYKTGTSFQMHQKKVYLSGTFALWNSLPQVGMVAKRLHELWTSWKAFSEFWIKRHFIWSCQYLNWSFWKTTDKQEQLLFIWLLYSLATHKLLVTTRAKLMN